MISNHFSWESDHRYRVHVVTVSRLFEAIDFVASWVCALSGHRLERWYSRVSNKAWDRTERVASIEVTREQMLKLSPRLVRNIERDWA